MEPSKPRIKPSTSLKEIFSVRKIKLTDLVSKSYLGQVWGTSLTQEKPKKALLFTHSWLLLQSAALQGAAFTLTAFLKLLRAVLYQVHSGHPAWGSFPIPVVVLCLQMLHPAQGSAPSLPVLGLRGRGRVGVTGQLSAALETSRAIARSGEDSREA